MHPLESGTRVEKIGSEAGDAHQDGALGRIRHVLGPVDGKYGYFVVWDDTPGVPVFVSDYRVRSHTTVS